MLPEKVCLDTAAAALSLAHIVSSEGKELKIGSTFPIPQEFEKILDFTPYESINSLQKREVVLSINKKKGEVKAVRWREIDDQIQFIITPEMGEFEFNDVDLESVGGAFDLIITIGCEKLSTAGSIYSSNPSPFFDTKILNIDINPANANFGSTNKVGSESSLSAWVLKLAGEEDLTVDQRTIETLFKGIFWSNEGFRKDSSLEKAVEKLAASEGSLTSIVTQMSDTLTVAELRYIAKMISNMEVETEGIIHTKIQNSDLQGVSLDRIIYPEVNILSRLSDYTVVFVLTEYERNKVLVRVYARDEQKDVFKLFSDYTPFGNSRNITFTVKGELDSIEEKLLERLRGASTGEDDDSRQVSQGPNDKEVKKENNTRKEINKIEKDKEKTETYKDPLPEAIEFPEPVEAPPVEFTPQISPMSQPSPLPQPPISPIYPTQPLPPVQMM